MAEEMNIEIDGENLSEELAKHSSKFVYAAEQAVNAQLAYESFKQKVAELYALLDRDTRAAAEADSKKITEKVVENTIILNEDYQKAGRHLLQLRANSEILKCRRDGWEKRGSMLVQMSSNRRSEMEALTFDTIKEKVA